jgi:hypothetical protein
MVQVCGKVGHAPVANVLLITRREGAVSLAFVGTLNRIKVLTYNDVSEASPLAQIFN